MGDWFHQNGLSSSVEETIKKREPMIKKAIFEVVGIIEDFRIQSLGAMRSAIELFELAILPSLLNNSEVWVEISEASMKRLSELQYLFARTLFQVGKGTPKPALLVQTALLGMSQRIMMRKLTFVNALKHMSEDTLARQILEEQVEMELPGLAMECRQFCHRLGLEDITMVDIPTQEWKKMVKEAVLMDHIKEMKVEM